MAKKINTTGFKVLAITCIVVGTLMLIENFGYLVGIHKLWPVFPFTLGLGFLLLYKNIKIKKHKDLGLLFLGIYICLNSLFFLFLNMTSWRLLARWWPVFIAIFGLTTLLCHHYHKKKIYMYSGLFLLFTATTFIFVFGISVKLWPICLILLGIFIYLLTREWKK